MFPDGSILHDPALSATVFDCVTHAQGSRLCYILPSFLSNVLRPLLQGVFCLIYSIKEKQRATGQDRIFFFIPVYIVGAYVWYTSIPRKRYLNLYCSLSFFRGYKLFKF